MTPDETWRNHVFIKLEETHTKHDTPHVDSFRHWTLIIVLFIRTSASCVHRPPDSFFFIYRSAHPMQLWIQDDDERPRTWSQKFNRRGAPVGIPKQPQALPKRHSSFGKAAPRLANPEMTKNRESWACQNNTGVHFIPKICLACAAYAEVPRAPSSWYKIVCIT